MIQDLPLDFDQQIDPRIEKPNTLYHVGVSGGKDSGAALLWAKENLPHAKIVASFCNTHNEHEWTYAHIKMLNANVWPIKTLEPELGFFELALDRHRFPSACARFCTEQLKIMPTKAYIEELRYQGFEVIAITGVRADESEDRKHLPEWGFNSILRCFEYRPLLRWKLADVLAIHAKKLFETTYGRFSSFFGPGSVPDQFCSRKEWSEKKQQFVMVPTIDDVVKWSMTGDRAKGRFDDTGQKEKHGCTSGYCE